MNQIKIGRFIAECRKKTNLTQMQLAEKLGITDKAISKWERGVAMPDTSIMLNLCDILGISVNELLNGEKIYMENSNQKNEQLLLDMAKELEKKNKVIWTSMWAIMIVSITALPQISTFIHQNNLVDFLLFHSDPIQCLQDSQLAVQAHIRIGHHIGNLGKHRGANQPFFYINIPKNF